MSELKQGDLVKRFHEERDSGSRAYVHTLIKGVGFIGIGLHIQPRHGLSRFKIFSAKEDAQVRAMRKGVCGLPVCEVHLQARGPGVYVCSQHWNAWSAVA